MLDTPVQAAATLLERIEEGDVEHGTKVRDIYRKQWAGLGKIEEVTAAITILEEHGWVRLTTVKPEGRGRPSEVLHIYPDLRG
jgi:predicted transcriptional regulator